MTDRVVAQLNGALAERYEVMREIGRGGMATVYLARDVRHQRNVALKVLNPDLGAVLGAERFLAEIQVTAKLQHPNLLPLFDSGEAEGLLFYVMPFVDGESLRGRLDREKQLPVEEALRLAIAVSSALAYAHRHDVIHRDLKPENILLHEGQPLVADFGIALAVSKAGGARITQTGISLGTPQYMSPEQATGDRAIDGRTDIYSLAAMLYEMLTGDPPHTASTSQGVIAKVVTDRPRGVRATRAAVPEHVEAALDRALEKLPADRWRTADEFADALSGRVKATLTPRSIAARPPRWRDPVVLGALGLAIGALGAAGVLFTRARNPDSPPVVRFTLTTPPGAPPAGGLALSPDGRILVYLAATPRGSQLYARPLDQTVAQPIAGTEGAIPQAVFSPDGKWIAFIADGKLKKVPAGGGTPIALADASGGTGMDWSVSNVIVLGQEPRVRCLQRVSADGGQLTEFVKLDSSVGVVFCDTPVVLADGKTVLFFMAVASSINRSSIAVTTLDGGPLDTLNISLAEPIGVVDGQLLYVTADGTIMATPFDLRHRRVGPHAVPLIGDVAMCFTCMGLAIPRNGTIAYAHGGAPTHLSWLGERDTAVDVARESRSYSDPRLSPNGRSIAFTSVWGAGNRADVSILDVATGTVHRLTSEGDNDAPEWTRDGKVIFASIRDGKSALWIQSAAGATPAERLTDPSAMYTDGVVSPDGRLILAKTFDGRYAVLDTIALVGDHTPHAFLHLGNGNAASPCFSPDGHWFAHNSNQTGRREVYVRSFANPTVVIPISTGGGSEAVWSRDGRHLFYRSADSKIIDVSVTTSPTFAIQSRRVLADDKFAVGSNAPGYDVSIDGKRLLVVRSTVDHAEITVVTNWLSEVRRRLEKQP